MRKIISGVGLLLTTAVLSGCATSSMVSQYAGMPRDALPRDHVEYTPTSVGRHERTSAAADQPDSKPATAFSLDDENQRLAKVLRICRNCGGVSPSAHKHSDRPGIRRTLSGPFALSSGATLKG